MKNKYLVCNPCGRLSRSPGWGQLHYGIAIQDRLGPWMLGVTAGLGGQFDIPGKKDPWLRNCLRQTRRGGGGEQCFHDCWLVSEGLYLNSQTSLEPKSNDLICLCLSFPTCHMRRNNYKDLTYECFYNTHHKLSSVQLPWAQIKCCVYVTTMVYFPINKKRIAKEAVKRPSWHWLFPQAKVSANFLSIQLMNLWLRIMRILPVLPGICWRDTVFPASGYHMAYLSPTAACPKYSLCTFKTSTCVCGDYPRKPLYLLYLLSLRTPYVIEWAAKQELPELHTWTW